MTLSVAITMPKNQSCGCRVIKHRGILLYNFENERHINVLAPPPPRDLHFGQPCPIRTPES